MKTRRIMLFSAVCCMLALICILCPVRAKAAVPKITKLSANKTYKSFDLNGDKKKDTIRLKTTKSGYEGRAYLYINGKKVYTMSGLSLGYESCAGMRIISLKNGKNFIYLYGEGENPLCGKEKLLRYRNGKIFLIEDFNKILKQYASGAYLSWYTSDAIKISGNTISVKVEAMTWTLGGKTIVFKYKYSNGTLKRSGSTAAIVNSGKSYYTAAKPFSVYKKVGSSVKAFDVKRGQNVEVKKVWIKGGKAWFSVENMAGKSGWIKGVTNNAMGYGTSPLFSNVGYVS